MRIVLAAALACLMAGCVKEVTLSTTFDAREAAYINTKGKARIEGQAFLRRNDGVVVYGAGSAIQLIPATTYARERFAAIYAGKKMSPALNPTKFNETDPSYTANTRTAKANGEGRFSFDEVAPGKYFVTALVTWCAPSQYGCITQGGSLHEEVTIRGSEKTELVMSGQ